MTKYTIVVANLWKKKKMWGRRGGAGKFLWAGNEETAFTNARQDGVEFVTCVTASVHEDNLILIHTKRRYSLSLSQPITLASTKIFERTLQNHIGLIKRANATFMACVIMILWKQRYTEHETHVEETMNAYNISQELERDETKKKTQERMERRSRKRSSSAGSEKMDRVGDR